MEEAVIVTGGSRRIGKRICQTLASNGFFVIIHYNSSSREADSLASTIRDQGGQAETIECDLSKVTDVETLIHRTETLFRVKVTGLVNNASRYSYDDVNTIEVEKFSGHMIVNAYSPLILSRELHKTGDGWAVSYTHLTLPTTVDV